MQTTELPIYMDSKESELSIKIKNLSKELEENDLPHLFIVLMNSECTGKNLLSSSHIVKEGEDNKEAGLRFSKLLSGIEFILNSVCKSFKFKIVHEKI